MSAAPCSTTALIAAGVLAAVSVSCSGGGPGRPDILLITIDTLRADRVGAYGAGHVQTPALDRLAREGIRFDAAYAVAPLTLPSHVSMLSGWLPAAHGVRANDAFGVPAGVPLVAESLRDAGYDTAAFVGAFVLRRGTGISRGFAHFDDEVGRAGERRGEQVVRRAREWLARRDPNRPVFAWVHLFDPHLDYDPPEPHRSRYADRPYDGEVAYADWCVERLIELLEEDGGLDRTAIIAAADHGEALGDHGERSHGATLYESAIRVPLIVRVAGGSPGTVVHTPVSSAAIAPTVLDVAGIPRPSGGPESLLRHVDSSTRALDDPVISETLYLRLLLGWTALYSARIGPHKIIDGPTPELYDMAVDPAEKANLGVVHPDRAERLRQALRRGVAAAASAGVPAIPAPPDRAAQQKLAALGYVSSGRSNVRPDEPVGGADIRSRLPLWLQIEEAMERSQKDDAEGAETLFKSVLRADPENVLALKFLGARALQRGDLQRAVEYNERVVASGLHVGEALSNLALAFERLGRPTDALKATDAAIAREPDLVVARYNRAVILLGMGRVEDAVRESDEVLRREPQHTAALELKERAGSARSVLVQVEALAARGDVQGALAEIERAIRGRPSDAALHDVRGVLLSRSGELGDAAQAFERALQLSPDNVEVLERLGAVRHKRGDRQAARAAFDRVLVLDPSRQGPRLSLSILDLEQGDARRAASRLESIDAEWSAAYQVQFYLGEARRRLGDTAGARRAYQACVKMAPADSPVRSAATRQLAELR